MFRPYVDNGNVRKSFPTYKEVKSKMKELIENSFCGEVNVYRSRRGEWGEWFEKWVRVNGKPAIVKQGWM